MADLEIRLFGGLQLVQNGLVLSNFLSNKVPALFAYLAVTRRPHQREALAALLWGGLPEADAKNNLRQTLSNLKRLLDPHLSITRETVAFKETESYSLDVARFEQARLTATQPVTETQLQSLQEAATLYRGDFLAGFLVREAPEFEEWALAQRARYRELALNTLQTLTQCHLERGHYTQAIDSAIHLLSVDSWREEAHRQLMLALARSGQRSAALAQYKTCSQILEKELGVEPSSETKTLYERIRAVDSIRHNLPPQPTTFVGRMNELAKIESLLLRPECRLLSVVGVGGSGKSRLALQAAERFLKMGAFLSGIYFVSLAAIDTPEQLAPAIATACSLTLSGNHDPKIQLIDFLHNQETLLLLDNFEHVLDARAWLSELLKSAPSIKLLVTSRERLNLQSEWLLALDGLDYPESASETDGAHFSAVQLFASRARMAQTDFELNPANQPSVVRVCQLVEGLPLGIELASVWTQTHTCAEIVREIERSYDFLITSTYDVPERQKSLRAVFEHSWQLLAEPDQTLFSRLSVFRGGFTLEAAEEVAGASAARLLSLQNKSMLRRSESGRYELQEVMRQFADDKLRHSNNLEITYQTHSNYFAQWLEMLKAWMRDQRRADAWALITTELPNLISLWQRVCERRDWQNLDRAVQPLYSFYDAAGRFHEGLGVLTLAESSFDETVPEILRARIANRRGVLLWRLGRLHEARQAFESVLQVVQAPAREAAMERANALHQLGNVNYLLGDYGAAKEHFLVGLELWRALDDSRRVVDVLNGLAAAEAALENVVEARDHYRTGIELARAAGNLSAVALMTDGLALVERDSGDLAEGLRLHEEALRVIQQLGDHARLVNQYVNLGEIHYLRGELDEAHRYLEQVLPDARALGEASSVLVYTLKNLGLVACDREQFDEARLWLGQALAAAQASNSSMLILMVLAGYAHWLVARGQFAEGAHLGAFILSQTAIDRATRKAARRTLELTTANLPEATRTAVRNDARANTLTNWVARFLPANQ